MLFADFLRRPARQWLTLALPAEDAAASLQAGAGYFQVRLSEMFLTHERWLTQEISPAALCMCEFKYGSGDARVPFFVSNEMLAGVGAGGRKLQNTRVRFKDTRVVGQAPYLGGDVGLYVGLFRVVIKDSRKVLFSVFEKLFSSCVGGLGSYLQLADKVADDLLESFGMGDVECVLAERNVFGTPVRPLRDGYLAMLDCDAARLGGTQLSVVDGRLHAGTGPEARPFDLCDYCLVRLETSAKRDDVTTLPFHARWKEARGKLLRGELAQARAALIECQSGVFASEDLTEDHKYQLMEWYQAAFLKDQQLFAGTAAAAPQRSDGDRGTSPATDAVQQMARLAELAKFRSQQLRESVDRIGRLSVPQIVPASGGPAQDAAELAREPDWEAAIGLHLQPPERARSREDAQLLLGTLISAMVAPPALDD